MANARIGAHTGKAHTGKTVPIRAHTRAAGRDRGLGHADLLRTALKDMDQGILVLDKEQRLALWNRRAVELLAIPAELCRKGLPVAKLLKRFHHDQGLLPDEVERVVARQLDEFRTDHQMTLPSEAFGGRSLERQCRALPDGGAVLTYIDIRETKRREQETAESRALLATTLDNMDQGILVLDAAMNVRLWNERIIDLLKLPHGFIHPGLPMADILRFVGLRAGRTPETQEQRTVELLANFRQEWSMTVNNLNPDGRVIETRRRPMPDGGVVITYADVTERSERERLLDEKSRLLSTTLANIEQGILVLDEDLSILTWNERLVRMFALPADYLHVGLNAHELVRYLSLRAGRSAEEADKIASARAGGLRRSELVVLSGADTSGRVLERRSRPLEGGGLAVIYTDVTERKRHEREIAEKSAQLAATLDNMDQGLVVVDRNDQVMLWNDRFVDMFDIPPDLVGLGKPFKGLLRFFIITAGVPLDRVDDEVVQGLHDLHSSPFSVVDRHCPDGRAFERRCRIMEDGSCVITYTDVTERRRAEEESKRAREDAELASRVKTEFMANMSHELRTPLNAIIGFSDVLAHELFGPLGNRRYIEYARDVRESGQHLLSVINDVLDVAKVEVNKIELREEVVDCVAVVNSCMRLVQERAITAGVTVTKHFGPNLPNLFADERRLKQIILNLLSNAVKFTPADGTVSVRVGSDAKGFRIEVSDTGIGIAEQDIERALAPFGQIDSRLARRYDGAGLGLPLARSLTELHGGRLEIASEPSHGTTVTIWLPPGRILLSPPTNE
jgi:signal transduction histidine kinase